MAKKQTKSKREPKDIVISEQRAFEGVWIPKKLYITNKFNLRTKFFVVEIKSLSKKGYCYATDKHFSDFLGISDRMVQIMIKQLKDDGYLTAEYEYEKGTNAIKRRFLILTNKFYNEFYNEKSEKGSEKDFNTPTEKDFDEPIEENFNTGAEKNCGEKYNNKTNNNNSSSNTDSSVIDKGRNINKVNGEADTTFSKKSLPTATPKKTKAELEKLEQEMIKRFYAIGKQYDVSDNALKNVSSAFVRYLQRYTEKTGKIHPILSDKTLEKIFTTMASVSDTEYGHFDFIADEEPNSDGLSYIDMIVDEHFRAEHSIDTDWHISHFANQDYLDMMAQHVVEW